MDPSLYKTASTSRHLKYFVYHSEATDISKPTLLFLHGFPASSYDWRYQVAFFRNRGHAIVVPDMLGYGGTDKPLDAASYAPSLIAQDIVDLLDALQIQGPIVAIGHDWGSLIVSRLANVHADRFSAFAFYAVGYNAPNPTVAFSDFLAYTSKLVGREPFGYMKFFSEEGAPQRISEHYDSFWDAIFSSRATDFDKATNFGPTGAFKAWLSQDQRVPLPDYLPDDEARITKENFKMSGIAAPLNWYKMFTSSIIQEDSKLIPQDKYVIQKPVLFGGGSKDVITIAALGKDLTAKLCPNLSYKEYASGHSPHWEAKDQVNDLATWIDNL